MAAFSSSSSQKVRPTECTERSGLEYIYRRLGLDNFAGLPNNYEKNCKAKKDMNASVGTFPRPTIGRAIINRFDGCRSIPYEYKYSDQSINQTRCHPSARPYLFSHPSLVASSYQPEFATSQPPKKLDTAELRTSIRSCCTFRSACNCSLLR